MFSSIKVEIKPHDIISAVKKMKKTEREYSIKYLSPFLSSRG